jgi:hypothetical protein
MEPPLNGQVSKEGLPLQASCSVGQEMPKGIQACASLRYAKVLLIRICWASAAFNFLRGLPQTRVKHRRGSAFLTSLSIVQLGNRYIRSCCCYLVVLPSCWCFL